MSGWSGPPPENTVLRSDWKYAPALIQAMDLHPSVPATPNQDDWGRLYYVVFDYHERPSHQPHSHSKHAMLLPLSFSGLP